MISSWMTSHETDVDDLRASLDHSQDYASIPDCVSDFWIHGMDEHEEVDFAPSHAVSLMDIVKDGQVCTIESAQAVFEAEQMLLSAFANSIPCPVTNTKQSLKELLGVIYDETNYKIKRITKVYNPCTEYMHESFRKCYDIQNEKQVYHGTTFEFAENIIHGGFRNVGCRAKFGKGIYCSTSVWECLLYANPSFANDWEQTFVVANLLVGPSAVGKQDMINFGKDEQGRQILTLTDEKGQIFCASKDDQLAAMYQITVKYDFTKPRTDAKIQKVMYLHPFVAKNLNVQAKVPPTPGSNALTSGQPVAPSTTSVAKPTNNVIQLTEHAGFKIGDTVTIIDTFAMYKFCINTTGIVQKISRKTQQYVKIHVEPCDDAIRQKVAEVHDKKELESWENKKWLQCKFTQIKHKASQDYILYRDTKTWVNALKKKKSDEKRVLQILDIDKNTLDTWFKHGETMTQITTKLRKQIKKHMDESNTSPVTDSQLGKRKCPMRT